MVLYATHSNDFAPLSCTLRPGITADAERCGEICYQAFAHIAGQHNFPADFPSPGVATEFLAGLLQHPGFFSVVAEQGGHIVGSNFLDERSMIAGIGPITVDPDTQNRNVGRQLMLRVIDRAHEKGFPGVRLVQAAYHNRSLSLYCKLGFAVREPLSIMQGQPPRFELAGYTTRAATEGDLAACNRLCTEVHGHDRAGELTDAISAQTATVVEFGGQIVGYTTAIAFFGHTVATSNDAIKVLIASAAGFGGPGFLLPSRNSELMSWCLEHGLRVIQPMTLMSMGLYSEPRGAWLPAVLY